MDETPQDDMSALLDSATSQAERTRKNAIKQLRSTATKLKNQHDDSPDIVRDSVTHMAENLYAIADYLDSLSIDQVVAIPTAPEAGSPAGVIQVAEQPALPSVAAQDSLPMDSAMDSSPAQGISPQAAEREQSLVMGISFLAGMVVGLLLRRR